MLSQDSDWSRKYLNNQGPSGMNSNFQPSFLSLFCAAYRYFEIHISVSNLDMEYVFVVNNQLLLDKKMFCFLSVTRDSARDRRKSQTTVSVCSSAPPAITIL